ncbi:protein of unknown function DUF881 [Caldalkalibacillus thermarum TA2.A1]|uniref:DUF881 domain-containing protein n=1 Tax=Caldalkalibacillus thermarum (strain TA2.A1) TaxID=986075 RepID=F5L903_CALTT|nr:DUF881 domain-containing protein [Caldalkalibacillus thermarum]EGL82177.1 protein of unknown function DUF881 [Caldalkalibacillus thermarum TA2.A1]QZT33109.1 DUF881 domain-containing protein [Caldalkalibacillus thermarum TA2.A1]
MKKSIAIKVTRIHLLLTVVLLCAGYLLAYSYNYTKELALEQEESSKSVAHWEAEDQLREKLIDAQKENVQLEERLRELQFQVSEKEEEMSQMESKLADIYSELESYRLLAGLIEAKGPGVIVTLDDQDYAEEALDPNDYIVHEQDVRGVVNELFAAGAEGVSINGQRFVQTTAIRCVGPTIIVNGIKSSAPFQIAAVGDPDVLYQALHLPGGYVELLQSWGITVTVEKQDEIILPAYVGEL